MVSLTSSPKNPTASVLQMELTKQSNHVYCRQYSLYQCPTLSIYRILVSLERTKAERHLSLDLPNILAFSFFQTDCLINLCLSALSTHCVGTIMIGSLGMEQSNTYCLNVFFDVLKLLTVVLQRLWPFQNVSYVLKWLSCFKTISLVFSQPLFFNSVHALQF